MTTSTERIWNEHADQLRGFIYRRIPDPSVVDDLVQDVFLKVQSKVATLKDETRLQSWLYQITRNTIIDHFRGQKPEQELPETLDLPEAEPSRALEELAECVRPMMDVLPEEYRLPLLLSDLEGLPQKEVAERLGLSVSAAKSRVQRGRERLKSAFTKCCHLTLDHRGSVMDYQARDGECGRC
ncbi:MAG TPA: RNA polymerase sigma factor SigZ [Terriglobia bacterium]|nr:RNA polymerase sigma factor SigZ [Terriglobia bacterium]